jgi:hypothetical protein
MLLESVEGVTEAWREREVMALATNWVRIVRQWAQDEERSDAAWPTVSRERRT